MAGRVSREKSIGAGGEDEDIVGDGFARGAGDEFVLGVDLGDFGVEVAV